MTSLPLETQPLLNEPASALPQQERAAADPGAGSPTADSPGPVSETNPVRGSASAIDAHEVALDLEWTRLKEELPKAETAAKDANAHLKRVKMELEAARQLVAHHRRLHQRLAK